MEIKSSPYPCHVFVCCKTRGNERTSCGDGDNAALKALLKAEVKKRGWSDRVRVSDSGCLGQCDRGPNVMIYPHKIWFSGVEMDDAADILSALEAVLAGDD